ncbi:hypothetical protein KC19_VG239300 [Ceratodon purpureus]|uniref:Uncharacterized protein n=1 Tax=Ceratodon purpureus TaxID=3225 RepID=A0A8T0HSZ8_CERPU|nr:hypothetical protein KC19_VG239300 [Ceratodon purpureus]
MILLQHWQRFFGVSFVLGRLLTPSFVRVVPSWCVSHVSRDGSQIRNRSAHIAVHPSLSRSL